MQTNKTNVPISNIDNQTYKLSHFHEDFMKYEYKSLKNENNLKNNPKKLIIYDRKGKTYIKSQNPICPECNSKLITKNGIKPRLLYFYYKKEVNTEVQRYKCVKCGKSFTTDISEIVDDNSNYTHEIKEKTLDLVGLFYGSLRKVAYKIKKDTEIDISIQTIENWILNVEDPNKGKIKRYSGYYIFDTEWSKIDGTWSYRFTLFDSKFNTVIADEFYSEETSANIKDFLERSTFNQDKFAITSDLKEEYKPVIEKLGFKHQWCTIHGTKNINKHIKEYFKENKVSEDEKEIIKIYKQDIFNLFKSKSYKEARKDFNNMLEIVDEYPIIIQDILINLIMPYFKTYFLYLLDNKVEKTSNKIENIFLKTFPRHVKKIMKTFKGAITRIWLRQEIWDMNNMLKN
jgi:transposase-like protein